MFFVSADSESQVEQSFSRIAVAAELANPEDSCTMKCEMFRSLFESNLVVEKWLMIIDGADELEVLLGPKKLIKYLPASGSVIFTTRNSKLALEHVQNEEKVVYLHGLSPDNGVTLLQNRLGRNNELKHMLEPVDLLEGLPLALSQAAPFVATTCGSVHAYIRLYHEDEVTKIGLLGEGRSYKDGSVANPVSKTWQISFERIQRDDQFAADILCFAACLHHRHIPISLIPASGRGPGIAIAMGVLQTHCFISWNSLKNTFSMHPLIRLATRHWLRLNNQLERYAQSTLDLFCKQFPPEFKQDKQLAQGDRLFIHVHTVLTNLSYDGREQCCAKLASGVSVFLRVKGDYKGALSYAQTAATLSENRCGQEDLCTLTIQSDLAYLYWRLGKFPEAGQLTKKILQMRMKMLGQDHKSTLESLDLLSVILNYEGNYAAAEYCLRQVFEARRKVLGPCHNDTMTSLNDLGVSLKRQKRYKEAETAFRQAFMEREKTDGLYFAALRAMNNLGSVLQLQADFENALLYYEEVYQTRKMLFGSNHHDTLKSKQNIAIVQRKQGQLEEAEIRTRDVLNGCERSLGNDHPTTL